MLRLDTSKASGGFNAELDGQVFSFNSLSTKQLDQFSKLMDTIRAGKSVSALAQATAGLLRQVVSPRDKYVEWEREVKARSEAAYVQAITVLGRELLALNNPESVVVEGGDAGPVLGEGEASTVGATATADASTAENGAVGEVLSEEEAAVAAFLAELEDA